MTSPVTEYTSRITVETPNPEAFRKSSQMIARQQERQTIRIDRMSTEYRDTGIVIPRKRPITVTVAGDIASGKTTLIAVVAEALRSTGHHATVPQQSLGARIDSLEELFDVTFIEQDSSTFDRKVEDAIRLRTDLMRKDYEDRIKRLEIDARFLKGLVDHASKTIPESREALAELALLVAKQARRLRELEAAS